MSKRGLSMEEKKMKMLEIFHETAEFYSLKELEKIAPKTKGIVVQSVKEVLDDIISDGFVQMDKIGTGNYFWSLPSAAGATKQALLAKNKKELEAINEKIKEVQADIEDAEKGREDTPDRRNLIAQLNGLNETSSSLKKELSAFGAADPIKYEKKSKAIQVCKNSAVQWTDNTLILLTHISNSGVDTEGIKANLGITDEWEDLQT